MARSCPACPARSKRSSTTSASSTTGSSPSSITTPRTRSAKKSGFRAAPMPGSPRPRRSPRKRNNSTLEHDPEKWEPVFRNDHAQTIRRGRVSRPPLRFSTDAFPAADAGEVLSRAAPALTGKKDASTMATITAAMVKDLRESTGAGMMDCKTALTESGGDIQAAQDWLRKKGLSKAAKKAGRVAAEGLIGAVTSATKGVVVEVNSETDFVARNEQFQGLVKMIAQVALKVGADVEKIKAAKIGDVTVERAITDAIATIGENMTLRRAALLEVRKGVVASYIHDA